METDWRNYLLRCNFTEFGDQLAKIPLGQPDEGSLRLIAAALDAIGPRDERGKWSFDQMAAEWSLFGVEVVYNGKNSRNFATISIFKYCLLLRFPNWVTSPVGDLYMCWNDPVATPKE